MHQRWARFYALHPHSICRDSISLGCASIMTLNRYQSMATRSNSVCSIRCDVFCEDFNVDITAELMTLLFDQ